MNTDNLYSTNSNNSNSHTQGHQPPPSPVDLNNDDQCQRNTPTICTGRSRSNTLTNSSTDAVDMASASVSNQFDHVMRPRRPSLISRPSGLTSLSMPSPPSIPTSSTGHTIGTPPSSRPSHYRPESLLPQYHEVDMTMSSSNNSSSNGLDAKTTTTTTATTTSEASMVHQMGFLPRILVLIGLFGMSLGGLYMLAQVLPPLSLPKSIDDVKVDAEILQEFATATFEGWLRTFWVFSAVYLWKQCFGIPGSAFLVRLVSKRDSRPFTY